LISQTFSYSMKRARRDPTQNGKAMAQKTERFNPANSAARQKGGPRWCWLKLIPLGLTWCSGPGRPRMQVPDIYTFR
jgi:hypothetical protein